MHNSPFYKKCSNTYSSKVELIFCFLFNPQAAELGTTMNEGVKKVSTRVCQTAIKSQRIGRGFGIDF